MSDMKVCCNREIFEKSYREVSNIYFYEMKVILPSCNRATFCFQALDINVRTIDRISQFETNLHEVQSNMKEIQKYLKVDTIVPIGNKAMIRGHLVHTNEIFVNLGDRWFLKTSSEKALEISGRMIESNREKR
jgi:hypothetical protein